MSTDPDAPSDDDATRQGDATSDDDAAVRAVWRDIFTPRATPLPEHPTLCIRVRDRIPEMERDPRLKRLDWIERLGVLQYAGYELAIKPAEYLEAVSQFMPLFAEDDPPMREQWLRMARIFRAAFYEAQDLNSEFLKQADSAARAVLKQHDDTSLFSARFAAFVRLRDEVVSMLQMNNTTAHIATQLWIAMSQPHNHEIARHIPDLNHAQIPKQKMLDKLDVARARPHKPGDFNEQAEYMIRAWLRAKGCPDEIVKGAFDAERARDERELGLR